MSRVDRFRLLLSLAIGIGALIVAGTPIYAGDNQCGTVFTGNQRPDVDTCPGDLRTRTIVVGVLVFGAVVLVPWTSALSSLRRRFGRDATRDDRPRQLW